MTLIFKAPTDEAERVKWRAQANNAAAHMKQMKDWGTMQVFTPAFVFDDGIVKLPIDVALIQSLDEQALADWVFDSVLTRAAIEKQGHGDVAEVCDEPASDEPRPCMRRLEPDFTKPCPNNSTGGLRITLKPAETVEKRWGARSLLTFVMDLTVCADCLPKVKIMEITDPELRASLGKVAQQQNSGILVDWKRTLIEQVAFNDPHYLALRQQMEKAAPANDGGAAA